MKVARSLPLALITALGVQAGTSLVTPTGSATATLKFTLDSYKIDTITVDGVQYSRVVSPELSAMTLDKGFPELPYGAEAIRLLKNGEAQLKIESVKYKEIAALPVVPSKGKMNRNIDPATVNATAGLIYNENKFWPEQPVTLDSPYLIRDIRGVSAKITPISYNGKTGTIRIAEEITFSVTETGVTPRATSNDPSEEFQKGLEDRFINGTEPVMLRYTPVKDGDKMAIITTAEFKAAADELALWKNKKGITATVYTYPTETGNGASGVLAFLKGLYTSQKITYVTIVGDHEDVPSTIVNYDDGQTPNDAKVASDPSFSYLSGKDKYPDVFVGRISVETAPSANDVVKKIINYEKSPEIGGTWYSKSVSVGSSEGTPTDYQWLADSINTILKSSGAYTSINEIKQGFGESTTALSNYINEGRGLINFMGHGNNDGFGFKSNFWYSSAIIKGLTNSSRLPVVIPLACQFGAFSGKTVAAEEWLRNPKGGAVVTMGSSPLMDWTPPQHAQVEMNRLIAKGTYSSMGAYFYNGEMKMLDVVTTDGYKTVDTWNYFGDPSLQLINAAPVALKLAISGSPVIGSNKLTVTGTAGTKVTLYSPELNIQTSGTITGTSVDLSFTTSKVGKIYLTGTAKNSIPYLDSLTVSAVEEKNVAPTDITLSSTTIIAGSPIGTFIAKVTVTDPNVKDTHKIALECTCSNLKLSNDSLFVAGVIAENDTMNIALTANDQGDLGIRKTFSVIGTKNPYYDILKNGAWKATADKLGSSADISVDSKTGAFTGTFKRSANAQSDKWCSISTALTSSLKALTEIRITYQASDSIRVNLPMDALLESGAVHGITLPATGTKSATVTFKSSQLVQPSWTASADKATLDLSKVRSISFELASEDENAVTGTISVSAIGLNGYAPAPVSLLDAQSFSSLESIQVRGISSHQIMIGVPTAGVYKIILFGLNGRMIYNQTASLSAGFQNIPLNQLSATGPVVIKIQGATGSFVTKAILK